MSKRQIRICLGSSYFSRGNNTNLGAIKKYLRGNNLETEIIFCGHLKDTIESLPKNILEHLNVSYSPCLGCGKGEQAPPFIEVNRKRIAGVSKNSLVQIVKKEVRNVI